MNNNLNLSIYIQLITFRKGTSDEISINVPEDCQVRTARCLSERLGFRFRYSYDTRKVIITRDSSLHSLEFLDLNNFETDMQGSFYDDYIDTTDANMDVDISAYQDFSTLLSEFTSDFEASAQSIDFSDEVYADIPLIVDDATFGNFTSNFQDEHDDGEMLPDWNDLVNIVDNHDVDLDTNMLDGTQLDDSSFDDITGSCQATELAIKTPATTATQNTITDIPAWRNTPLASAAILDVPTPRPLSRAESVRSAPSKNSQSQGIDIVIKPNLDRNESSLSNTPSSYQEGVFSSTPGFSSMPTTYGSSPRRMGPLDCVTRAKANAVKAIGACWRCRFLRKPVSSPIYYLVFS